MPMPSMISVKTSAPTGTVREKLTFSPTPSSQNANPIHSTGPYLQRCQRLSIHKPGRETERYLANLVINGPDTAPATLSVTSNGNKRVAVCSAV